MNTIVHILSLHIHSMDKNPVQNDLYEVNYVHTYVPI